jgi:multisubunit Na+/H+ antiporter MnhE subunit
MLHAAAMLMAVWLLWLLLTQSWGGPEIWALGFGVAAACVMFAARFGGVSGNAFARAPHFFALTMERAPAVLRGSLMTIRAAIAADVTLKPALVRVKARPSSLEARAALANMISAAPGAMVVEADQEGLLVHVIDEDAIEAAHLGALEGRVVAALDGKAQP